MRTQLDGKWALVCGASQGIGEAAAIELAALGAKVVLLSRDQKKLASVKAKLKNSKDHLTLAFDLSDYKNLNSFLSKNLSNDQRPVILVNNSGGPPAGPLVDANAQDLQNALSSHVCAAHEILKFALPEMKKKNFGRVINVISTSVKAPIQNLGVSNTVRGAMANWAKTMSLELGVFGVTVNNVLPGYTETPRLEALVKKAAEKLKISEGQVKEMWLDTIPLRRFANPQETGEVIAFLATDAAGYINGINLPVDGGRTQSL